MSEPIGPGGSGAPASTGASGERRARHHGENGRGRSGRMGNGNCGRGSGSRKSEKIAVCGGRSLRRVTAAGAAGLRLRAEGRRCGRAGARGVGT